MKTVYYAYRCSEKGNDAGALGLFPTEKDAKEVVKGQGFWGDDGRYYELNLYESADEYLAFREEKNIMEKEGLKAKALSKLSLEEKKSLGLL